MLFNKNTYRKTNDKKLLHKIGKRWVTISIAMLALLGGGMVASSTTHASANVAPNSRAQTIAVKNSMNQRLQQKPQSNSGSVQNSQASGSNTNDIMNQAKAMHRNIVGNAPTNVSNSSAESSSNNSASGKSSSSSASKTKGLMLDAPAPSKPESTNSNVANSESNKVSQSSSVSASSSNASGNGMNTLDLGNSSQQARGWNFVQHGIRNNDYDRTPVNNSGSSSVNNSASGNQTASVSSSNAKTDTASAPINQTNQNSLNSLNAKLKAMEPSTNASSSASVASANPVNADSNSNKNENNKALLKDNAQPDYFSGDVTTTGNVDGLNFTAYANGGIEFTDGTANSNLSNFSSAIKQGVEGTNLVDYLGNLKAKAIKFDNDVDTSNVTNMSGMFDGDGTLQLLTLPNSFDTSKVTDMSNMFSADNSLQSLTLPSSFNTSKVTNMSGMFSADNSLQSLILPSSFNTKNVTNMSGMFSNISVQSLTLPNLFDTSKVTNMSNMFREIPLQYLTLPNSFDTSNVTNMSEMFTGTGLQSLTLPNSFDTRKATDMSEMFQSDDLLISLTIQSPNTKFTDSSDFNSIESVQSLYKKDTNDNYTSTTPNDFSKGNLGTFVPKNPAPSSDTATINFQDNGKLIKSYATPKEKFNSTTTANNVSNTLPSDYQVLNPSQVIIYNGSTQNVAVKYVPSEWDTISYEYQPNSNRKDYYEVINQGQAYGRQGTNYTIQSSDVPTGYQLVNPNDNSFTFGSSKGLHRIMIKPSTNADIPAIPNTVNIKGTVTLHFSDNGKTRDIKLDYLTQDSDAKQINVLGDVDYNNGVNTKPTDFIGKMIQGFDTTNFTYNGDNDAGEYTPSQSDTDYNHGSTKLLDHDVTLNFTAKQGTNPVQNGSNDTIEYTDGNGRVIGSTVVNGHTGSDFTPKSDMTNANVPKGYHLAPSQAPINYDGSTHNVKVVGNNVPDTSITIKQSNGTTANIPVNGHKIGDKITINPSQYDPNGYSANSSDAPITVTVVPSNNSKGYQLQPSGNDTTPNAKNNVYDPSNNTISYNYHYDPDHANNTITVQYKNQNGKVVGTKSYNVAPGNKVDPSTNLPDGYNQGANHSTTTASNSPQTITYNVTGKSANQLPSTTNQGKVNLHIVEKSNGNQVNSYNVQVNEGSKLVGSDFTIDPTQSTDINGNKLVPKGYATDNTDKVITGMITNNGAVTDSGTDTLIYDAQGKNGYNIHYQNPSNPNDTSKDIVVPTNNDKTGQHLTNADVPNGYHLPSDTSFSFNSDGNIINDKTGQQIPNNRVPLEGNDIQGKANIVLKYQVLDPTGNNVVKTVYNNADDAQVILNGQVGGSQTIKPWRYWKKDFTIPSGVANQSDTIHFTPSDDNANDENGQQFNPILTYTSTAQQAGDVVVNYVDTDNHNKQISQQDVGNFSDLVGQTVRLGQKEPSDNDANINNDNNVKYVLEVPQGYHLEYNSNPITLGIGQVASSNPAVHYPKSGLGMLFNASRVYHRPVGLFLTVGLTKPVTPNKPKNSASTSSSSSTSVKPSSATSVTSSSASSASSSANNSTSVTSSGNTYISNTSYISYVTNNYSSSANTANSYASASMATPVITPAVNPVVTPTVNPTTESTNTTTVESASAKPNEVVNNDNDNNTIYNISGSKADKLVQRIPVGSRMYHKNVTIKRLSQKKLGMYYIRVTRPTWIYRGTRFTRRNRIKVLKPKDIIAVPIQRIFRINGRMVFQVRIRVSRHHNSAFITGNRRYVRNAYIQPKELRGHHYVRVLRNAELYRSPRYSNQTRVGNVYRGSKLRVKRIRYIASKHMTRIQLTNGRWLTANKNFVKIIK